MTPVTFIETEDKEKISDLTPVVPALDNGNGKALKKDQLRKMLHIAKAVRQGNLSVRFPVEEDGIPSEIGEVLNDILDLNENMINEFARVSAIVGEEGKLNERASIGPVKGAWA